MNSKELTDSLAEFAKSKNIDRPTMIRLLEDVFKTMIRKKYGSDESFSVIINAESGDLEMFHYREIISDDSEEKNDPNKISISEARKHQVDFEVGEELAEPITLESFGRRVVMTARQTLIQRIKDLEKESLYKKYKALVGEIIVGEVYQIVGRDIIVIDKEKNELMIPKVEQISKDRYRKGDPIKAVVEKVEMINSVPKIVLSRTSSGFLEKLFENEVPEIYDGLITIKRVVREPGERAKVAVESYDDRIDPVGACVGVKGSRIHNIVKELGNENIDVINYTENIDLFITRALSPAKISSIKAEEPGRVAVYLKPDQVSLAIGKGGQNIRLASRLVGLEIDVFRDVEEGEYEEDVELTEFQDEVEDWILDELRRIGLDTAKSVLALSKDELVRRTDLEEETVEFILETFKKEFE